MAEGNNVTCSICGASVSKRQTLSVGAGKRACRTHPEAAQQAEAAVSAQKAKNDAVTKKLIADRDKWKPQHREPVEPLGPRCSICGKLGMEQGQYMERFLIEKAKHEIVHQKTVNPFNTEEMAAALAPLKDIEILLWIEWTGENKKIILPHKVFRLFRMAEDMGIHHVLTCRECLKRYPFKTYGEQNADNLKNMSMKNMLTLGAIVGDVVDGIAHEELARDN